MYNSIVSKVALEGRGFRPKFSVMMLVRSIPRIPQRGEIYISAHLAQDADRSAWWHIAQNSGFQPEWVSIPYPDRIETHLLLHYERRDEETPLGDDFDVQLEALSEAGIPDEAIRLVYGGLRSIAAETLVVEKTN